MCRAIDVPQRDKASPPPTANQIEELPYAVELWDEEHRQVEKILARALKISLARAIFRAALEEYPNRRIVLRQDERIVEDNGA